MSYSRLDLDMLIQKYYQDIKKGKRNDPHFTAERLYDYLYGCHLTPKENKEYEEEIKWLINCINEM